ncbi:glycerophosphodiester phosphodiesterase [Methylosarcina fibrata]|uniref:glycerophosphodiester phosphodiesterase n=1 Tax=Methylosarcina fibrata TaxID=105972 RepID=UPI000524F15E|nr:glycerophosphodiester phosphodiesterase family protein [Methylosarcina fibrata]
MNPLRGTDPMRGAGVLNIAHRGARAYAPENTLAAFAKAVSFGCPMIEIDVHRSKDGELVVHHDDQLGRCTDVKTKFPERSSYYVSDFTWNELNELDAGSWYAGQLALPAHRRDYPLHGVTQEELDRYVSTEELAYYASGQIKLPTLKETLEFAQEAGLMVNVELKTLPRMYPGLAEAVVRLVETMAMENRVLISSFDHAQLVVVRRLSPLIATAVLTGDRLASPREYLQRIDADAYHPSTDSVGLGSLEGEPDPAGWADVLASGRRVNVWTCNDKKQMRQLLEAGITGLISDFPNRVAEVLQEAAEKTQRI